MAKLNQIHLDTHVLIWLSKKQTKKISRRVHRLMESTPLRIYSPMVELELHFLYEIGRLKRTPEEMLTSLDEDIGLTVSSSKFADVVRQATQIGWTRDIFDRLIVADAMANDAPLVTADESIHAHYAKAVC